MKKTKQGITLIALVITIIVLLILAGITINLTIGENGILRQAQNAGIENEKAAIKEKIELAILDIKSDKLALRKEMTREDLKELEGIGATIESTGIPAQGQYNDYYFEIDEDYKVEVIGKVKGEKPVIQAVVKTEGIVEQGGTVEIEVTASISEGSITALEATNGATLKEEISITEKTFTVSANGTYTFKVTADNGRSNTASVEVSTIIEKPVIDIKDVTQEGFTIVVTNNYVEGLVTEYKYYVGENLKREGTTDKEYIITGLGEEMEYTTYVEVYIEEKKLTSDIITVTTESEIVEVVWTNNTTENRTIDGKTATYQNPIIPVGFSAVNTNSAKWNVTNGILSEWNNGLVIKNATDSNEFVWVPVDGNNVTYVRWCTNGQSYSDCTDIASENGLDIADNVKDYGGFWVARYESGLPTTIAQTTANTTTRNVSGKPLSQPGAVPWNCIKWSVAQANAQSMYSDEYMQSGLINGTQWDTIMKWVQEAGYDVTTDSTKWGNYNNSSLMLRGGKYAYVSEDYGAEWISATSTSAQLIKTGASNDTKVKNIYDLAGNLWEWTSEYPNSKTNYRILRGGYYGVNGSGYEAAKRQTNSTNYSRYGFRVQLYIK